MGEQRVTRDGRILEKMPDGSIVEVGRQGGGQQGTVFTIPGDPYKARSAAAEEERLRMAQGEQSRSAAEWQATHNPDGSPKLKPKEELDRRTALADAQAAYRNMASLEGYVKDLRRQYDANFKGKGIGSIAEYLPAVARPANGVFNDTGQSLLADMAKAKGLTAQQFNTPAEQKMFFEPLIPKAGDTDEQIVSKINRLEQMIGSGKTNYAGQINALGGEAPQQVPNVWDQVNAQGDGPRPIAFGSTGGNDGITQPIPPEANQEYAAYYMQNAGRLNPQEYAAFRQSLAKKYGFEIPPGVDLLQEAAEMNDYYAKGGRGTPSLTPPNKKMSELDWLRNSAVNNPVGAGVANFADSVSMGGVSALTGNRMSDLAREQPKSAFAGQVAGAIAGSEGLGYVGRQIAQRVAPKLLGGGRAAGFGRQVAQDAAYGGAYGQNANGDAAGGALLGGLGSAGGQLAGKVVGKGIGGLAKTPFAETMERSYVPMTVGQNLGGMFKATEDKAMSIPIVGDMIRRRRLESFDAFDQAARNEAGAPIGAQFAPGGNWIEELPPQFGQAYDNATAGVKVPLDPQFTADMQAARARGAALPPDFVPKFDAAVTNRVMPIAQAGELTGDTYQQAMRGLKGYKSEMTKPGFEADYRDALSGVQGALKGQMQRGGGESVVTGLANADQAYRLAKVVQNAQQRAVNGTGSGTGGVITPAQLNTAAIGNMRKFGGARPFAELGDAGQATLPSTIPDSGTAGRLALQGATLAGLGGTGYAAGGMDGTQNALLMAALLAAGGSKTGQTALNKALFSRPAAAKALGSAISKRKGLFGSASIPLLLESNQ